MAATAPIPNKKFDITPETWNEDAIKAAWEPPPYNDDRVWSVYGASKTQAEQEVWKFVKEKNPHFVCNTVLPNANFGTILVKGQPASTGEWVTGLYKGDTESLKGVPPRKSVSSHAFRQNL